MPGGVIGNSVAFAGDMTGDGAVEVLVGAPGTSGGGAVFVYSATSASLPSSVAGQINAPTGFASFGLAISH